MDFTKIKARAKELGKKSVETGKILSQKWIEASQKAGKSLANLTEDKLRDSKFVIKDKKVFDTLIVSSKNKDFTDKKTGISKTFTWRAVVFICEKESEFTSKLLYRLPLILTKSFAQNISFWIMLWEIEGVDVKKYKFKTYPSLILFENEKVQKVIEGEENIQKVVNSLSLDINKTIDEL